MSLKKLEIFGFKSFAERTEVVFEPGVTCIVGPNGCGKSNVSDSIRWVLGERSAKMLRGSKMEDIIFNGTDFRKPLGFAEVHLTFDNRNQIIPIEYDEVVISRKLYRSGESEYFINKTLCRYKDIQDLLMDTGIGSSSYSMIEQGRIDYILTADPDKRRQLIEEAAGISKFKSKREEAVRKLERTEGNLLRLGDIVAEIEKNIKYAERQARKAEKYKEQFEELKSLEISKAIIEIKKLKEQLVDFNNKKSEYERLLSETQKKLQQVEIQLNEKQRTIKELESEVNEGEVKKVELSSKINSLKEKTYFNTERIGSLKNQKEESDKEIFSSTERIEILNNEIKVLEQELSKRKEENETFETRVNSINSQITEKEAELNKNKSYLDDCHSNQRDIHSQKSQMGQSRSQIESRAASLKTKIEHLEDDVIKITSHTSEIDNKKANADTVNDKLKQAIHEFEVKVSATKNELSKKDVEIDELRKLVIQTEGKLKEIETQTELLTSNNQEESSRSFKKLVKEKQVDKESPLFQKIFFVHEVFQPKPGSESKYNKLVRLFMNDEMLLDQWKSVYSFKQLSEGFRSSPISSFVNRNSIKLFAGNIEVAGVPLFPIVNSIDVKESFSNHLLNMFNDIYSSDFTLEELLSRNVHLALNQKQVVTQDGYLLGPGSKVTFPVSGEVDARLPEEKISDLSLAKETTIKNLEEYKHNESAAVSERKTIESTLTKENQELSAALTNYQTELKLFEQIDKNKESLSVQLLTLEQEINKSKINLQETESSLQIENEKLKDLNQKEVELNEVIGQYREKDGLLSKELEQIKLSRVQVEADYKNLGERINFLNESVERSKSAIVEDNNRIESRKKSIEEGESFIQQLIRDNESFQLQITEQNNVFIEIGQSINRIKDVLEVQTEEAKKIHLNVESTRRQLEETKESLHSNEMHVLEAKHSESAIIERIREAYKLDIANDIKEEDQITEETVSAEELSVQIEKLKQKVENYGAVNLLAVEEYDELKERFDFLNKQSEDLVQSRDSLLSAIRKINKTTKKLFEDTFNAVQSEFQNFFTTLFGGGSAMLTLIDEDNPLESGIEILARPPGKKLQLITLLSGGEKAMTAIALLFALFKIKPSPFCCLDEVDAPLDEANIDRFLSVVKLFLETSQFIIITHNRKTISMGDALYGVTMEETGISKLVSVKVNQDEKDSKLLEETVTQ